MECNTLDTVYENLANVIIETYSNVKNTKQLLSVLFEGAQNIDQSNGINKLFITILKKMGYNYHLINSQSSYIRDKISIIKKMIELGADPHFNNDISLIYACSYESAEVLKYFIDDYQLKINVIKEKIIDNWLGNADILLVLLENGIVVTNRLIHRAACNIKSLEILFNHGVSINKLFEHYSEVISIDKIDYFFDKIKNSTETIDASIINKFFINQ